MKTIEEIAAALNGIEYGAEIEPSILRAAKEAGVVIVHGYSDDNAELRGAIDDEIGCYDGGEAHFSAGKLLFNECENERCPHHLAEMKTATTLTINWCEVEPYAWTYKIPIEHATFDMMDEGKPWCRGIVFRVADIP